MSLASDIKDFLSTGGIATPIYIGEGPEKPDALLVVTPTMGVGPMRTFSGNAGDAPIEHCRVQVRSRAVAYVSAESLIAAAYSRLSGAGPRVLNGRRYYYICPTGTANYIGTDDASRPMFSANFDVWRAEST